MVHYIDKDALVAEIKRRINEINLDSIEDWRYRLQREHDIEVMKNILSLIDTLEVEEVDEQKKRMSKCPFRQVACNRYEDIPVFCDGRCSWVVDYPKLKKLKAQKGE